MNRIMAHTLTGSTPEASHTSTPLIKSPPKPSSTKNVKGEIWYSNASFFIGTHILAIYGILQLSPWSTLDMRTFWLCIASWQTATFGITVGYHRLWSHRSFTASLPLRAVLAGMGCMGFQGSIKWWVLRHRLHHRFTDTDSDPYNAKEGLFHSHVGWIFRKPNYPRMGLIDKKDLEIDPVVRFQHKHYVPLTLFLGIVLPTLIGATYGDAMGGFVWGGIVSTVFIWHFTFFINSLAHYVGEQAYSEDLSARGNFILAVFTGGEANHNYHHAFPKDYRNGPRTFDWDPTKWIIYGLHNYTNLVPKVHQTPQSEILKAQAHVLASQSAAAKSKEIDSTSSFAKWSSYASDGGSASSVFSAASSSTGASSDEEDSVLDSSSNLRSHMKQRKVSGVPTWSRATLQSKLGEMEKMAMSGTTKESRKRPIVLLIDGYALDCTNYGQDHPGGLAYLKEYQLSSNVLSLKDASEVFNGGLNDHGWSAREKMSSLKIARIID